MDLVREVYAEEEIDGGVYYRVAGPGAQLPYTIVDGGSRTEGGLLTRGVDGRENAPSIRTYARDKRTPVVVTDAIEAKLRSDPPLNGYRVRIDLRTEAPPENENPPIYGEILQPRIITH